MSRRIMLGEYPYTYVRTVAMRSKLLKQADYDKVLKMSLVEITKFLQDSGYKQEIDELAVQLEGADLLEGAIQKNIEKSFFKLRKISPEELNIAIDMYLKRHHFFNLKTIIRGKFAKESQEKIESLLVALGPITPDTYKEMIEADTIEVALALLPCFDKKANYALIETYKETKSVAHVDDALDTAYLDELQKFAKRLMGQGTLVKEFLLYEVDIQSLKLFLRDKLRGIKGHDLVHKSTFTGTLFPLTLFRTIAHYDFEQITKSLLGTSLKEVFKEVKGREKDPNYLSILERELDRFLLKRSSLLIHQHPLSADVILGYMFSKDLEAKNLRTIIKGRQLGLSDDFIEHQVIV